MGRYPGKATCDVSGLLLDELRPVLALNLTAAEAADLDADGLLNDSATHTVDAKTYATMLAQPPQARKISFTPSASADAGNILVAGTDIDDNPITDTVATSTTAAVYSAKAFKTVASVTYPKDDGGITWDAGWSEAIGLPLKLVAAPFALEKFNGVVEIGTAGTFTVDANELSKNIYDPNGNLDGAKALQLLLFI
jgi:hypothetical protein